MAVKEIAIGKRAKISEAQQYMLIAVLGASLFLGAAVALCTHFIKEIAYHATVVSKEDEAIVQYSNTIKNIGVCKKPKGDVYTLEELKKCNPDEVDIADVPGTMRSDIVENMSANQSLNSVPKESSTGCINPSTSTNYTYEELNKLYSKATSASERNEATQLIKKCSALRIIPDALPAFKNDEALLSSLNKIFIVSGWEPERLSPSGEQEASELGAGLNEINVNLSVESDIATATTIINNIEHSIRDFNFKTAIFEWSSDDNVSFRATANAYYVDKSELVESTYTVPLEGKK